MWGLGRSSHPAPIVPYPHSSRPRSPEASDSEFLTVPGAQSPRPQSPGSSEPRSSQSPSLTDPLPAPQSFVSLIAPIPTVPGPGRHSNPQSPSPHGHCPSKLQVPHSPHPSQSWVPADPVLTAPSSHSTRPHSLGSPHPRGLRLPTPHSPGSPSSKATGPPTSPVPAYRAFAARPCQPLNPGDPSPGRSNSAALPASAFVGPPTTAGLSNQNQEPLPLDANQSRTGCGLALTRSGARPAGVSTLSMRGGKGVNPGKPTGSAGESAGGDEALGAHQKSITGRGWVRQLEGSQGLGLWEEVSEGRDCAPG